MHRYETCWYIQKRVLFSFDLSVKLYLFVLSVPFWLFSQFTVLMILKVIGNILCLSVSIELAFHKLFV